MGAGAASIGVSTGPGAERLCKQVQRVHALSPMVSAESAFRTAWHRVGGMLSQDTAAAVAIIAEQTVSVVARGGASAWVLRNKSILAFTEVAEHCTVDGAPVAFSRALRPCDVVVVAANGAEISEDVLAAVIDSGKFENHVKCLAR